MSKKQEEKEVEQSEEMLTQKVDDESSALSSCEKNENSSSEVLNETKEETIDKSLDTIEQEAMDVDFDKEVIEERIAEAKQTESPQKKKKSQITNAIFLIINIVLMAFIVSGFMSEYSNGFDLGLIVSNQGSRLWWLLAGLLMYVIFIVAETGMFTSMIKASVGKRKPYLSYRVSLLGKYYDNITPFSVGGEPVQIMELSKAGMSAGVATSLPIIKVIVYNLVNASIIFVSFIFGMPMMFSSDMISNFLLLLLNFVAIIGFIFTALVGILFILIGNGKIVGRGLARFLVKAGYKLRIVKNYRTAYNKIMRTVREYQNSVAFLQKNKGTMVKCILLCFLQLVAYYSIPFFVVLAFTSTTEVTFSLWFMCFVKFLVCNMASVIIPLPGGTGMMELSFMFLFGTPDLLGTSVAIGLLVWRILSYYILILHGFAQTIVDHTVTAVKLRRQEKTLKLDEKQQK